MIELGSITSDICGLIHGKTGMLATDRRLETPIYPSAVVEAREKSMELVAGGRQVLRKVDVTISCFPTREKEPEAVNGSVYAVYGALLPWFPTCGRKLSPMGLTTGGGQISFSLEFCDLPPETSTANTRHMETITIALGKTDGKE